MVYSILRWSISRRMATGVLQPKSAKESVAAIRSIVTLMQALAALLVFHWMVAASAKESNSTTGGWPSAAINGGDKSMGPCLSAGKFHYRSRIQTTPNALFLGPSKCGTVSLANWMAHHPDTRWFSNKRMGFPMRSKSGRDARSDISDYTIFMEDMVVGPDGTYGFTASPANDSTCLIDYAAHYLTITGMPYGILMRLGATATDGTTKYIVSLREPAARTISSWEFKYSWESEQEGFDPKKAAVGAGFRRLADVVSEGIEGVNRFLDCIGGEDQRPTADREEQCVLDFERCPPESYMGPNGNLYLAQVGKGMYALQLQRWFKILGQQNFKVLFFEETITHPLATMQSIFDFLGIDLIDRNGRGYPECLEYWERVVSVIHNETSEKKKEKLGQEVTPEIMKTLRDFFAPHNTELERLLGRPLPENWSKLPE